MTKSKPPKYCIDKSKNKAFVRHDGKNKTYLPGTINSIESREAYSRIETQFWVNARLPVAERLPANFGLPSEMEKPTVGEVALQFLQWTEATKSKSNHTDYRIAIIDFLVAHFGSTPVDEFTAGNLNLVRDAIIQSRRFCRNGVNEYTTRIAKLFTWGVSMGLVTPMTAWALSTVKSLEGGHPGTFEHPPKEYVKDWVIIATLPFLPPVLQAMIKLMRLLGMRPSEVFNMRVGEIDRHSVPDVWLYIPKSHKTKTKTGKDRVFSFNPTEQALIAPYLEGKKSGDSVFSPRTAMKERFPDRNINPKIRDFYNKDSLREAVFYAIEKANRQLPEDQQIPNWTPYDLRRAGLSAISVEIGGEAAQAIAGHTHESTTAIYLKREAEKLTKLAIEREKHSPF
jgi:integrase